MQSVTAVHVEKQRMTCCHCDLEWDDYPGALGQHFKDGCPQCASLYWRAEPIDGTAASLAFGATKYDAALKALAKR